MKNIKYKKRTFFTLLVASLLPVFAVSCGSSGNLFEKTYTQTPKEKAQKLLAAGDYDGAIKVLEDYLAENPDDSEAKSALVYAYQKRKKYEPVNVLAKIASGGSDGGGDWQSLATAMPAGTQENVDELKKAAALLSSIPADQRTDEQNYQLAITNVTLAVTQAKMVATDENGNVDSTKAADMTDDQAQTIIDSINGASTALASSGSNGETDNANKLSSLSTGINSSEGSTPKEQLLNYLQKK